MCTYVAADLGPDSPEFSFWLEDHKRSGKIQKNYVDSSNAMEMVAAKRRWFRPEKSKFRYNTILSYGDARRHKFNDKERCAGEDWLSAILPEATSAVRAMGFNKTTVSKFFENLTVCMEKHKFLPTRIYNVDETGLTAVPKTQPKVLAQKRRRQVGTLVSAERGQLVTAEIGFSAAGQYIPLLIFPRIMMEELLDGAPPGTIAICHPSGWM
ncbi:hypothetical protein ANN_20610 [Periplaneta americana]|uniref:Transposase n=1 Tax=Periplaneta americana TaxID=6978 RepID=A0ABQ8SD20_PERAM|nr:hypothetical protein ANN_20610 [Periplaneta americana]